jgi:hypothetical protein
MNVIYTCCDEKYQWFLPTWAYSARRAWLDARLVIDFFGCGLRPECLAILCNIGVEVTAGSDTIPSCVRFTYGSRGDSETLITDCDIAFLDDGVLPYLRTKMLLDGLGCYAAFQGVKKHPIRPDIAPDGWVGNMRRLCGGFVLVTQEWYDKTKKARTKFHGMIADGSWGGYREADEVMLCRICEESGLPLPSYHKFEERHRNLHLGDFRHGMDHRWQNITKMIRLLPQSSVFKARELLADKGFQDVLSVVMGHGNAEANCAWNNATAHIANRRP